jgi:transcriptional regulator GlxA family with amidase domain
MIHVSILVPETAVPQAIVDPRYMFTAVNGFLANTGKEPLFDVQLVGLTEAVALSDGVVTIKVDALLADVAQTNLIIVPAISGDVRTALECNKEMLPWIVAQYYKGAEVASLCIGAFLLANTGLLNGRTCSTHWLYADLFREFFPEVHLVDEKIITEQNRLYSSGGANSYWNLLLYLVEKHTNREMAILASKYFVIETMRNSQSPFIIFKTQKTHQDDTIRRAQEYIEQHYMDRLTVDGLADLLATGRRSLERRFKAATNNTVTEYIQRVKMEAAKKSFETRRDNINEVMYAVGYTDPKAFRTTFKKITGLSPAEYRNKYKRTA